MTAQTDTDSRADPAAQRRWRRALGWFLGTGLGLFALCVALIVIVDPYRSLAFSPDFERPIMEVNQRYTYPAVARDPAYDSAVIGTSTIRLLKPELLGEAFGGRFAQLAMNSGTAWEQTRILDLFLRARRDDPPGTVLVGVDKVWCASQPTPRITERGFPDWMYDDSAWNDLPFLINAKSIEIAGRMLGYLWFGRGEPRYRPDGWWNFLPGPEEYDLARVRRALYGQAEPTPFPVFDGEAPSAAELRARSFPDHAMFEAMVAALPPETRLVVVFVPYHASMLGPVGAGMAAPHAACKRRITDIARSHPRAHVFDFMVHSQITQTDANYWDPLHYTVETADRLVRLMGAALEAGESPSPAMRYRYRAEPARQTGPVETLDW